ncbi:hypothetical protein NXT3_PA00352 (plasmid) [Sinorhizobium fredii]|uniref:Uncharacterized protein n=1 Tax=Rhizobium fredii TaxID=380 RepID=A0A2L0HD04_RHIFR|nr:hypothetical protein NXT3_PA00352 [Sinorhizobium fredii]
MHLRAGDPRRVAVSERVNDGLDIREWVGRPTRDPSRKSRRPWFRWESADHFDV